MRYRLPAMLALAASCMALQIGCASWLPQQRAARQTSSRAADSRTDVRENLVDEIGRLVEEWFYAPARLEEVAWDTAVVHASHAFSGARAADAQAHIIQDLLARLGTSHTAFYQRDALGYAELASIFEPVLQRDCQAERAPRVPVTHDDIGVSWRQIGARWFVAGVHAGGPAETARLRVGDEIVTAGGAPFSPVTAFADRAQTPVSLEVRRTREGPLIPLLVTPRRARPNQAFRDAIAQSWRILERGGKRIAYIRVWSWTSVEIHEAVLEAIVKSNRARVDGIILDLRDGWGGADPAYLNIFGSTVPVLESTDRAGEVTAYDPQIRGPAAILINEGTRSGKEVIAYGAKKHGLAQLVGTRTAGAVLAGRPFCLADGSLLYLAVRDIRVDGERLEGRGVQPDIEVPFDLAYAAGRDPQLEQALDLLARE